MTFITFTPNLLFKNTPRMFKQGDIVIQIEDSFIIHPLAQKILEKYKADGYKICMTDFQFTPRYFALLEFIDFIKIDVKLVSNVTSIDNILKLSKAFHKKCIVTGIDSKELYDKAKAVPFDYFEGSYIAEAMTTKAGKMEYLQSNFFQLVVAVTKDMPEMDEIEAIISRDASLTYALLKMVNSAYFALRHRTSSIKQALVILGLSQLKQWVYLLSFEQNETSRNSEEVLKKSFLRANFCSELYPHIEGMPITQADAYLLGMFSTLDVLVDAPIEEVMAEIPVADEVRAAIVSQEGICGTLYQLVLSYEKADWKKITENAEALGIPSAQLSTIYFNCMEEVNRIWEQMLNPSPVASKEELVDMAMHNDPQ